MSKALRFGFLLALAGLLLARPLLAADGIHGNLVTAQWLEQNLKNPDVLLLDASPTQMYAAAHIPGALGVDVFTWYGMDQTPGEMQKLYQAWGVSPEKKIVMYDQGGSYLATRLLFSLLHDGFPAGNLLVLDGGLFQWQKAGFAVTKDPSPAPPKGTFNIGKLNAGVSAALPEVLTASGDPLHNVLLEALGPDWHYGETGPFRAAGHIPRGVLLPSADFFTPDKTFKPAEEITRMLSYVGVKPEQQIYSYCGGGVAASVPFFALKFIVGYPKVKLYPGSEMEWLADERQLPYWTYDAPFLMRDTKWLQFWATPMVRMFVGARVSIVDVRPSADFNQGHLPFAVNIPAEVFQANAGNPAKLAEILGAAGVNPAHEAVVVSGGGLTRDAALAFAMLDKLGLSRVSLFTDSFDRAVQAGFALTKNPTAIGPKKAPQDLSIPPVAYSANLRPGVVIADAKNTQGVYPKVYIASGRQAPAKAPEGKVVLVPYTDLLNADGTPKAAKDIWKILTKAGVPRYAEMICISDDPGEAAANYFVLKLMGYPDVKVLL